MKIVIHKSDSRGEANHGWLLAKHSFSFASYYNPERINFGVLRVLNDDKIAPKAGFPEHPHDNMEIITIPLSGILKHKDNMGNIAEVKSGEVQVMSAGSGVFHSEYNGSKTEELNLLQIWVFPNKKNVEPRYDQISLVDVEKENEFYQILSPDANDQGVWIHQDAWFSMGSFSKGTSHKYTVKKDGNGVYLMVIDGEVFIEGYKLNSRDAIGISDIKELNLDVNTDSKVLLMDLPMIV